MIGSDQWAQIGKVEDQKDPKHRRKKGEGAEEGIRDQKGLIDFAFP